VVLLVRLFHGAITAFFLSCITCVYYSALTGKRNPLLVPAVAALVAEGAIVAANDGKCPLGTVHHRYGDDRDFFELFIPYSLSRHAVPILGTIAGVGIVVSLVRSTRARVRSQ
jgi:hypothetical protein